jgi:hypothetical protein
MSIRVYSDYKVCQRSTYEDLILKAAQAVLRTGNIYGPIWVSTDNYLKILTEQELNRESYKMCGEIIIAAAQENQG